MTLVSARRRQDVAAEPGPRAGFLAAQGIGIAKTPGPAPEGVLQARLARRRGAGTSEP